MAYRLIQFLVLWGALGVAWPVCADGPLVDPTRPPPEFGMSATESATLVTGPELQSVLIPRKGKPQAVISGQMVRLGEMYGDSRLVALDERAAVLEGPQGRSVLALTPGIEKSKVVRSSKLPAKASQSEVKP